MLNSSSRKILVVDDDEGVLSAYEEILAGSPHEDETAELMGMLSADQTQVSGGEGNDQPFDMVKAASAEEAIELFDAAFHGGAPFSTVFLDVRMPPGITGIECGARLRAIDPSVYLVIVTAYADYSTAEIRDALGVDFIYLKKPFVPEELSQVAELFAAYRDRDQKREVEMQRLREQNA